MTQFFEASPYNGVIVPQRPADLPDFENPPVCEVAIAGHFEPLVGLRQAHLGFFWSKIRDEFPEVEDREPLAPHLENLDDKTSSPLFHLEMTSSPMPNRAWFVASDHSELLQLQRDRFVHNWRYRNESSPTKLPNPEFQGFQMMLTFRAPISEPDISTLHELLLLGRSAIVHSFAGLTDTEYHKKWRRIQ